jgi:hypothetical protein
MRCVSRTVLGEVSVTMHTTCTIIFTLNRSNHHITSVSASARVHTTIYLLTIYFLAVVWILHLIIWSKIVDITIGLSLRVEGSRNYCSIQTLRSDHDAAHLI